MDHNKNTAADVAANFEVAELETRLENVWGEVPVDPVLPGEGPAGGGQ